MEKTVKLVRAAGIQIENHLLEIIIELHEMSKVKDDYLLSEIENKVNEVLSKYKQNN